MLRDFVEYMITVRHCFSCKHFRSNFNRYNSFDYGTCDKLGKYHPQQSHQGECGGKEYEIDQEWKQMVNNMVKEDDKEEDKK